ncbi:ABC transporter substrate-binding protein [Streptomyces sp.]|uniref:ABC transporter substrate-binding protein n=1 Tax=Streptomyces sp. TaxID=1931 RepID=UPI002F425996
MDGHLRTAIACVAAALVLAGCGTSAVRTSGPDGLRGRGPITFAQGKDRGVVRLQVEAWNKAHPRERVTLIELAEAPDAQRQQMVQNAQTRSDALTVLNLDVVWTAEFAAHRWITELPRDRFELSGFLKPTIDTGTYRDRLYAVPYTSDGGLLYYRKDLLAKAGARPPVTWEQMRQTCARVLALPEAKGMSCYAGQFDKYEGLTVNFAEAVDSAGGEIVDAQGRAHVDTPQARRGLEFLAQGLRSGTIPKDAVTFQEEEGRRAFQAGRLVFQRQWPYQWALASRTDGSSTVAGRFEVAPLPGLTGPGTSSLGGHNLAISAFGRNKATAADFIRYLTSEPLQRQSLQEQAFAPTLADLYDDPALRRQYPYLSVLKASILRAKPRPRLVWYGDATVAIQSAAYAALTGTKPADRALADLQADLAQQTNR